MLNFSSNASETFFNVSSSSQSTAKFPSLPLLIVTNNKTSLFVTTFETDTNSHSSYASPFSTSTLMIALPKPTHFTSPLSSTINASSFDDVNVKVVESCGLSTTVSWISLSISSSTTM